MTEKMYNKIFYCLKIKVHAKEGEVEVWHNIYPNINLVKMCGDGPYHEVKIREIRKNETSLYWGWKDFEDKKYSMIYYRKELAEMCFPYGYKAEEKRGRGKLVNLVITEIIT